MFRWIQYETHVTIKYTLSYIVYLPRSSQGVRFSASFGKGAFVKSEAIIHENQELEAYHSFQTVGALGGNQTLVDVPKMNGQPPAHAQIHH